MSLATRVATHGALVVGVLARPAIAQRIAPDPNAAFVAATIRGADRYRSQERAIADGYRPVGVEFPAMGEHWVNLQRVMADSIDPARPSILIYVTVGGEQRLGGVGFTSLLRPGEPLPSRPAAGFWHEHNGTIADESFPLRHHLGGSGSTDGTEALRLAVLHVWTHVANPAGYFATDNWTLPAQRLALSYSSLGASATRGAALAQDATGYYALVLRTALHPSDHEEDLIETTLAEAAAAARQAARDVARERESALAAAWDGLWRTLADRLPGHRDALRALRRQLS